MIHLDTSVLVDALSGGASGGRLRGVIAGGERIRLSTIVLYEWRRGPRRPAELAAQAKLFPAEEAVAVTPSIAEAAAELYKRVKRPRGREIDLIIAVCALSEDASLWTLNRQDFVDIPGISLYVPEA
jgi:predicted nucleic acid-binding protein